MVAKSRMLGMIGFSFSDCHFDFGGGGCTGSAKVFLGLIRSSVSCTPLKDIE